MKVDLKYVRSSFLFFIVTGLKFSSKYRGFHVLTMTKVEHSG